MELVVRSAVGFACTKGNCEWTPTSYVGDDNDGDDVPHEPTPDVAQV